LTWPTGLRQVPRCHRPLSWLDQRRLHHPCTLVFVDVPDVSHRGWSPGLLVPQSKPHVHLHSSRSVSTACLYLTFTSPSTTASEFHICTPQTNRHVAQPNLRRG
jgi:hypothetical protein